MRSVTSTVLCILGVLVVLTRRVLVGGLFVAVLLVGLPGGSRRTRVFGEFLCRASGAYDCGGIPGAERADAETIRVAAESYLLLHADAACPTVETLVTEGELSKQNRLRDERGHPFRLRCSGSWVSVVGAGADERFGTADDVGEEIEVARERDAP